MNHRQRQRRPGASLELIPGDRLDGADPTNLRRHKCRQTPSAYTNAGLAFKPRTNHCNRIKASINMTRIHSLTNQTSSDPIMDPTETIDWWFESTINSWVQITTWLIIRSSSTQITTGVNSSFRSIQIHWQIKLISVHPSSNIAQLRLS